MQKKSHNCLISLLDFTTQLVCVFWYKHITEIITKNIVIQVSFMHMGLTVPTFGLSGQFHVFIYEVCKLIAHPCIFNSISTLLIPLFICYYFPSHCAQLKKTSWKTKLRGQSNRLFINLVQEVARGSFFNRKSETPCCFYPYWNVNFQRCQIWRVCFFVTLNTHIIYFCRIIRRTYVRFHFSHNSFRFLPRNFTHRGHSTAKLSTTDTQRQTVRRPYTITAQERTFDGLLLLSISSTFHVCKIHSFKKTFFVKLLLFLNTSVDTDFLLICFIVHSRQCLEF